MWLQNLFGSFQARRKPIKNRLPKRTRLLVEALEARELLATITQWSFPATVAPPDNSPPPSTGTGTAITLGMGTGSNGYTGHTTDVASDDVLSSPGVANPAFAEQTWRIRGTPNNGWATHAAGAAQYVQGIELDASTVGYSNIQFLVRLVHDHIRAFATCNSSTTRTSPMRRAGPILAGPAPRAPTSLYPMTSTPGHHARNHGQPRCDRRRQQRREFRHSLGFRVRLHRQCSQ